MTKQPISYLRESFTFILVYVALLMIAFCVLIWFIDDIDTPTAFMLDMIVGFIAASLLMENHKRIKDYSNSTRRKIKL